MWLVDNPGIYDQFEDDKFVCYVEVTTGAAAAYHPQTTADVAVKLM